MLRTCFPSNLDSMFKNDSEGKASEENMKQTFSEEERARRAFQRVARILFELWEESEGYEGDTRYLREPMIPNKLVEVGRSKKGGSYYEHVVPLALLRDRYLQMFEEGKNIEEVAEFLRRHVKIVRITREEQQRLDHELGLKTRMPDGWLFDDVNADIYHRLGVCGIDWE